MLSAPPTSTAGRPEAAVASIVGIEYFSSIIGAPAAAGHVDVDATRATSAAVAA